MDRPTSHGRAGGGVIIFTVTLSRGEQVSALAMGLGAFGMVAFASYIEHGAVNWPMSGCIGLALFVLPHLTAFLVAVARDVAETVRKTAPVPPQTQQEAISDSEIETRAKESAAWKGRVLAFLTKVIAYNAGLPDHQQDRYRIWMWHVLPGERDGTNMGAQGWTDIVASLNDAGQIAEIGDDGTFAAMPVLALFNAIWEGKATALPRSKGSGGE